MYGSLSESSLNAAAALFDFTRCVRADGSVYGTSGKCRKGKETGAKEEPAKANEKETQAPKVKKAKETPEEKVEKKWLAQKAKVDSIQAEHDKIMEELKKQGITGYLAWKRPKMMRSILKERGIPSPSQLLRMRAKLQQTEPERLKKEREEVEKKQIASEIAGTSREKRKDMIREELENLKRKNQLKTLSEVNDSVKMLQQWVDMDPINATLKNRVALTALRVLRAKMARELRAEREAKKGDLDEALKKSPKYDETPGSRAPADVKSLLGEYGELKKRQRELEDRREEMEKATKLDDKWQKEYLETLNEISELSLRIPVGSPIKLEKIYELQGFNAKPELVRSRAELEQRKDIVREPDGRPLILYRGVSEEKYAKQFQGSGPDGDKHFPGWGIYGNGTYAASTGADPRKVPLSPGDTFESTAQRTAIGYSGDTANARDKVIAFALRSDANIVQFADTPDMPRNAAYSKWTDSIMDQAESRFGVRFTDHGEAAAAMGIHAYRVPRSDLEDYWVILNRGAVIAAQDSQLPDQ